MNRAILVTARLVCPGVDTGLAREAARDRVEADGYEYDAAGFFTPRAARAHAAFDAAGKAHREVMLNGHGPMQGAVLNVLGYLRKPPMGPVAASARARGAAAVDALRELVLVGQLVRDRHAERAVAFGRTVLTAIDADEIDAIAARYVADPLRETLCHLCNLTELRARVDGSAATAAE